MKNTLLLIKHNLSKNFAYGIKRICAFDFDHTLVCQKSGKAFPIDSDDWKLMFDNVKSKMEFMYNQGYMLMIFTNQGGVEKKKITIEMLKERLRNFLYYINLPILVVASLAYDKYRKPGTGMWDYVKTNFVPYENNLNLNECIYVGDGAGRIKGWIKGRKKDFSCSDRKFAYNIGIEFQTPEQFFLDSIPTKEWEWGGLDPVNYLQNISLRNVNEKQMIEEINEQEMIVLVGPPASGKSTLCKKLCNYTIVNLDTMKTKSKCIKATTIALSIGESVIIDNTNPDKASRKLFLDIAKSNNVKVRCIWMKASKELSLHLNEMRVQMGLKQKIPMIAYNIFYKKFEKPILEEGIDEIIEWDWIPNFENENHKKLFLNKY